MARVRALFVSWVCTSLIVSIALTAAACGAPREDVAGPTLATPAAAPTRTAQAEYTPAARPPDGRQGICCTWKFSYPNAEDSSG